nr:hypothetical protein [Tanacetum cinerariifolium]
MLQGIPTASYGDSPASTFSRLTITLQAKVVDPSLGNNTICELCGKGAHYGYNCSSKVSIIPALEPFNNQTVDELSQTLPNFDPTCYYEDGNSFTYDSTSNIVHDSPNIFDPPSQPPLYSCEFFENNARYGHYCTPQEEEKQIEEEQVAKARYWKILVCYNDDDEDYTIAITLTEPDNSLSMRDEHLDTIPATESDEFIKSSVKNLVPNPSESEVNSLFLNQFRQELMKLIVILRKKLILSSLLYDNSSSRPPEEFISKIFDIAFEFFSPFPIPVEDSDSFMEEIDLTFTPDDLMPPGIEEDDYDSERDILILEELPTNDSLSLLENE